jgi:hypothetical protein
MHKVLSLLHETFLSARVSCTIKGQEKGKSQLQAKDNPGSFTTHGRKYKTAQGGFQKTLNPVPCNMELANISFFCFTATRLHMKCSHPTSKSKKYL